MKATEKQIRYVHFLMNQANIRSNGWLGAWAKEWLTQRERQGRIDDIDAAAASKLIDGLKRKVDQKRCSLSP